MLKKVFMLLLLTIYSVCYADQYIFENSAQIKPNNPLNSQFVVNRKFFDINDIINRLKSLGINSKIKSYNQRELKNQYVNSNGTIKQFIELAANKFNYKINISDNYLVIFTAENPQKFDDTSNIRPLIQSSPIQSWDLEPSDKTLRSAVTKWCKKAGWQLVWNVNADFPITTAWDIDGSFENAINQVLTASQTTNVPLYAKMHDQNKVLEVYSEHSNNN